MSSHKPYTVFGASGFVGTALQKELQRQGHAVFAPDRLEAFDYPQLLGKENLGTVFYCIGMTADFRRQPFATIDANLLVLRLILEHGRFDRLVYLSSTRLYSGLARADEDVTLQFDVNSSDHLYNLSKAMAENLCLSSGRDVRVARLSNVYGAAMRPHNFLASILNSAACEGIVQFHTSAESVKDYIALDDVVRYLIAIADCSLYRLYNVASGVNTSHGAIAGELRQLGINVNFNNEAIRVDYPHIDVTRICNEFGPAQHSALKDLAGLMSAYRKDVVPN